MDAGSPMMPNWDDLRFFLAVARTGSTIAAARALGVNQTTVSRRIGELEARLGVRLFDRMREGFRLRADAAAMVEMAQRTEAEVRAFADMGAALGRGPERIRVTTNEPLANAVFAPAMMAFHARWPDVRVELVVSPRVLDLGRGEADVALRAWNQPDDPELIARRVADAYWAVYCGRDYARFNGVPRSLDALADHPAVLLDDPSGMQLSAIAALRSLDRRGSLNDLCIAARAGLGVVSLPCVLGDTLPDLVRCFVQPDPVTPIWLAHHPRLGDTPELRDLLDAIADQAHAARAILRGEGEQAPV